MKKDATKSLFDVAADINPKTDAVKTVTEVSVAESGQQHEVAKRTEIDPAIEEFRKRMRGYIDVLSRKPKGSRLVKQKDGFSYYPVGYYDRLVQDLFFGQTKKEIIEYKMIVNEITLHMRLHYKHPVTNEWLFVDGIAAIQVQQAKDTHLDQFMQMKIKNALQKNLPACYAEAYKNACKQIGNIFGADLNRKHEEEYSVQTNTVIPVNR
jgi:hypothetical protein